MDRKHRLLVVEDDFLIALDMIDLLENGGFDVIGPVPTLEASMQILAASFDTIDGAVLDVNLHGTASFPLADLLIDSNIPFVFATGYDTSSIPPRFENVPALEKPVDGKLVVGMIGQMIAERNSERSSV